MSRYIKVEGFLSAAASAASHPRLESNNGRVSKATFRKALRLCSLAMLDADAWGWRSLSFVVFIGNITGAFPSTMRLGDASCRR